MCDIHDLIDECGKANPPGVAVRTHWVPKDDIDVFPSYLATANPGDTVKLNGDIVLKANKKFNQVDIITNSGQIKDTLVGAIGSKSWESTFDFMKASTDPKVLEFFECLAKGCLVVLIKEKSGQTRVMGNLDSPAYLESAETDTGKQSGDTRGVTAQIKADIGRVAPVYEGVIDTDDLT